MGCCGGFGGVGANVPQWTRCLNFSYTDFTGFAALVGDIAIYSLLARGEIEAAVIKVSTPFVGPGITSLSLSAGIVGNLAKILSPYDALAAASATNFGTSDGLQVEDFSVATSIRLAAIAVGANLSALTAGAGCLWLKVAQIPPP
jgi:hypothetical protein